MRDTTPILTVIVYAAAFLQPNALAFKATRGVHAMTLVDQKPSALVASSAVPSSGIIDYIGCTVPLDGTVPRWSTDEMIFTAPTDKEIFDTQFNLFRQLPWKRIRGKFVLKAKISGSLPLEAASGGGFGFGGSADLEPVDSLAEFQNLLNYASVDPRVQAVVLEIGGLNCGYAKLQEARRMMSYFRQSGKKIIGYCSGGAEKELYFALGCDEFYIPPDGGLDLRGFSAAATFVRGVFDKIGIEPQVQRIGKYKSFGDTFNRTSISEAQREVVSSLLMEASDFWADSVALVLNKTAAEVMQLWADTVGNIKMYHMTDLTPPTNRIYTHAIGIKSPYDYKDLGFVTGIKYLDQVEDMVKATFRKEEKPDKISFWKNFFGNKEEDVVPNADIKAEVSEGDYTLANEFIENPRRKSKVFSLVPEELRVIEEKNEANKDAILAEFSNDKVKAQKKLSDLTSLVRKFSLKKQNSTELLTKLDFLNTMTIIFSRNLFTGNSDLKCQLQDGMGMVGNNNDAQLIRLNLNNQTVEVNNRLLDLHSTLNAAYVKLTEVYVAQSKKESAAASKKASAERRKVQSLDARFYPAGLYLKKMRKGNRILSGLQLKEVRGGPRIAVINAVGGIGSGKSGNGVNGKSLGSDTLISQVREARENSQVKAVVIRVDSPGGSALASDLMWREIRALSKQKPVIASMVDVAASGGYYIAMACDEIVAEELTITGSIGVVSSKFNAKELNSKIGFGVDSISRGRYAEVLSTSRGFTEEEDQYFADAARKAYVSFITKAAASRNMTVEALNEVAQGRVWTGRQALNIGLVDHIGGLNKALKIAASLCDLPSVPKGYSQGYRVQTFAEPRGSLPFPFGSASASLSAPSVFGADIQAICDDSVASSGLVSSESLGINPIFQVLGLNQLFAYNVAHTSAGSALIKSLQSLLSKSGFSQNNSIAEFFEDFFL